MSRHRAALWTASWPIWVSRSVPQGWRRQRSGCSTVVQDIRHVYFALLQERPARFGDAGRRYRWLAENRRVVRPIIRWRFLRRVPPATRWFSLRKTIESQLGCQRGSIQTPWSYSSLRRVALWNRPLKGRNPSSCSCRCGEGSWTGSSENWWCMQAKGDTPHHTTDAILRVYIYSSEEFEPKYVCNDLGVDVLN